MLRINKLYTTFKRMFEYDVIDDKTEINLETLNYLIQKQTIHQTVPTI